MVFPTFFNFSLNLVIRNSWSEPQSAPGLVFVNCIELLHLWPQNDVLFIIGNWNAKVSSQKIPGVKRKFGLGVQNEAGQRLIEFCQENALVIANTLFQQHKRRLYTWTSPDGQHQNQTDYTLRSCRWRSSIKSAKKKKKKTRRWLWLRSWIPYYKIQTSIEDSKENH